MLIGIPKELTENQTLVAGSPDTVKKLIKLGYEVCVEKLRLGILTNNMNRRGLASLMRLKPGVPI